MIEINLLPKNYLKGSHGISLGKAGVYAVAGVVGIVIMLGAVSMYQSFKLSKLETEIDQANHRAALLQKDIQLVDALTDVKAKISQRMMAVERLDRHRSVWVRVLSDVAANIPEFVWLSLYTEVAGNNAPPTDPNAEGEAPVTTSMNGPEVREIELEGYAFTLNSIASLMINMMRSDYFDEVELRSSEETKFGDDKEKAYRFVLAADVHYLSDEDLQNKLAQLAQAQANKSKTTHKVLN